MRYAEIGLGSKIDCQIRLCKISWRVSKQKVREDFRCDINRKQVKLSDNEKKTIDNKIALTAISL